MASCAMRLAFGWLLVACALCLARGGDKGVVQQADGHDTAARMTRKLLSGFGCSCSDASDCPCQLDTSWLEANECPSCPIYGCGDCDPLKCDECKRCCEGTVLSDDRKACTCPNCNITGCLECDAEDCSKCLVCHQGYKLGGDRKCECALCNVEYCETCDPADCHACKVCNPFLALASNGKACECPECPINGCEVCNPEKCDECLTCVNGEIPSYPDGCVIDPHCPIPHCDVCGSGGICKQCKYGYELTNYDTECKCSKCAVENCLECDPKDCDNCLKCKDGFDLSIPVGTDYKPAGPATCEVHDCGKKVPHCAVCSKKDPTWCEECNVGFEWDKKDKVCKCEHCNVPGCTTCDKDDCDKCTECGYGYQLQDDCTCACATCDVDYCTSCSVYDCNKCADGCCQDGYAATGPNGECVCASCSVPHCEKCSNSDCTKCEKCEYGYGPSGGEDCPCEMCTVPNCKTCSADDCGVCAECEDGHDLSDYGTCVWSPGKCKIEKCDECDESDLSQCKKCADGYVPSEYGTKCVCGYCAIEGCAECCPGECDTCNKCTAPLVLSKNKTSCDCPACKVSGCKECDPNDCGRCKVCDGLEDPDDYGQCGCPHCDIPNCAHCSATNCGTCEVCKPGYAPAYDGTCECTEAGLVGCLAPAGKINNCMCSECVKPLKRSDCGYCVVKDSEPGCDWSLVAAYDDKSCNLVCADDKVYTSSAVDASPDTYPCYADVGEEGIRSGTNSGKKPGVCTVEYQSGAPHKGLKPKTIDVTSFMCVCEKQPGITKWVEKDVGYDMHDRGCTDTCNTVISFYSQTRYNPVALPGFGDRSPSSPTAALPVSVCMIDGQVGYNVDEGAYKGYCMTPTAVAQEGYQCLCSESGSCGQPRCPNIPLTYAEAFRVFLVT